MVRQYPLQTDLRLQLLVGLFVGVWLYLFLSLVGPFDAAEVPMRDRIYLMVGYGFIFFLNYSITIVFQALWYNLSERWTVLSELIFLLAFSFVCYLFCFAYYQTEWVRGDWGRQRFLLEIYLPTLSIILPVIIAGRYLIRPRPKPAKEVKIIEVPQEEPMLVLSGSNKLDLLQLPAKDVVALSSAGNYVEVHFLESGQLRKKLLRATLQQLQRQAPDLLRVHRSHLINPQHFIAWKDHSTLSLPQLQVPVSQKYRAVVMAHPLFVPKEG
ncbi:MAG: LytTR family DNA-binding domain-containing protein [Bacteroidota bacterium]